MRNNKTPKKRRQATSRLPIIVVGGSVYRKRVEAQDPPAEAFDNKGADPAKEDPTKVPDDATWTKGASPEELRTKLTDLAARTKEALSKANIKGGDPQYAPTKNSIRVVSDLNPIGGKASTLTFVYSVSWKNIFTPGGWSDTKATLIEWDYCDMKFVSDTPDLTEKLLAGISVIQNADSKTTAFVSLPEGEQDKDVLKDWILYVASEMISHGVGAEKNIVKTDALKALDKAVIENLVEGGKDPKELIRNKLESESDKETGAMDLNSLIDYISGLVPRIIDATAAKAFITTLKELEAMPSNYFEKEQFLKMIQLAVKSGPLSKSDGEAAVRAMGTFKSDEEWRKALKDRVDTGKSLAPTKEAVVKAIDYLTSGVGYDVSKGVDTVLTDDKDIAVAIKAPFPFFYIFDFNGVKLVLKEASMKFCTLIFFLGKDKVKQHEDLLKADLAFAAAYGKAAGQEAKAPSKSKSSEELIKQILNYAEKVSAEGKGGEASSSPDLTSSPA